jgi:hypothetical protein
MTAPGGGATCRSRVSIPASALARCKRRACKRFFLEFSLVMLSSDTMVGISVRDFRGVSDTSTGVLIASSGKSKMVCATKAFYARASPTIMATIRTTSPQPFADGVGFDCAMKP